MTTLNIRIEEELKKYNFKSIRATKIKNGSMFVDIVTEVPLDAAGITAVPINPPL